MGSALAATLAASLTAMGSLAAGTATNAAPAMGHRELALCNARLEVLVDRLNDTDAQLSVGLNIREYRSLVARAQAAYNRVPFRRISGVCLTGVGVPAEKSLNAFLRAYNIWNDCIRYDLQDDCTVGATDRRVQRQWRTATLNLRRALRNLD